MIKRILGTPLLWLGLGLGVVMGVVAATGLDLSAEDTARFVGSLLGSLIAVAGAISLYFLKEKEDRDYRRRHLSYLVAQGRRYLTGLTKELDSKNYPRLTGGLKATAMYVDRCKRYCEAHESADLTVAKIGNYLDHVDSETLIGFMKLDFQYSLEEQQKIRDMVIAYSQFFDSAAEQSTDSAK